MKACGRCPGLEFEVRMLRGRVAQLVRAVASLAGWVDAQTAEPSMPAIRALHATKNRLYDLSNHTDHDGRR